MKKTLYFNDDTILAFHMGRGGRFHSGGYLTCEGEHKIGDFTGDLFLYADGKYYDGAQNCVGLTVDDEKTGIGRIDCDGVYNTIYTLRLGDISYDDKEAYVAVHESDGFTREQVILYFIQNETRDHQEIILEELGVDAEEYL